jgi:hypothetical protein
MRDQKRTRREEMEPICGTGNKQRIRREETEPICGTGNEQEDKKRGRYAAPESNKERRNGADILKHERTKREETEPFF